MANEIYWILEVDIKRGKLEELRDLMGEMSDATLKDEPGTLNYDWSLSADETACHIFERYADSAAVRAHLGNFGEKFAGRFLECLAPKRFVVYGDPDGQTREMLAGLNPVYMAPFGGFNR